MDTIGGALEHPRATTSSTVEVGVCVVGPFSVCLDGRVLTATEVGSRKARMLLALLALERRRLLPIARVVEALWGASPPRRPAQDVATLVSRLRVAIGGRAVQGGRAGGYRLGETVHVDLDDATALVDDATMLLDADPARAFVVARRALGMLRHGGVLDDMSDMEWAEPARSVHGVLLRRAGHATAEAALRTADPAAARDAAEAALRADPYDETACRLLMRAHRGCGESGRALAIYERLRERLASDLGIDPAAETRELHLVILRGGIDGTDRTDGTTWARPSVVVDSADRPGQHLVGRSAARAHLRRAWESAAEGRSKVVLLSGEAGIGKTILAGDLADSAAAAGALVAQARCHDAERSLFLEPIVKVLAQIVAAMPAGTVRAAAADRIDALAALAPQLAVALGRPDLGPAERGQSRRWTYDAVTTLLRRLSKAGPLVLIIEDVHVAGVATLELLRYLCCHPGDGRLLVVVTTRSDEGDRATRILGDVADQLDLGPLGSRDVRQLAEIHGQANVAAEIERCTRGHPLFVVEMLRALAKGEGGVPVSIQSSVLERIGRAGRKTEDLLRAAAVSGCPFYPATVARLVGISVTEATRRCERAVVSGLIRPAGSAYEFGNKLIRQVIYDTTPAPSRLAYLNAECPSAGPSSIPTQTDRSSLRTEGDSRPAPRRRPGGTWCTHPQGPG